MALERLDHRLVGLLEDLGEDPAEVADRLVVVDRERERDARRHRALLSPASVDGRSRRPASTIGTPAAGRYSSSVYSWSIRVVEKRHSAVAIARRMTVQPARRQPVGVALVVARDDLLLEDPVQVLRVAPVLGGLVGVRLATADRPAVVAVEALVPPAVEDADVGRRRSGPPSCRTCPDASSGRRGLLSQTSTPWTRKRATRMS